MVQVAQEKADLTEQSELLAKQIEKEEEELASLEQVKKDILMVGFKVEKVLKGSLDPFTFSENSNYGRESVLEVQRQNIAGYCQQNFELPQVNFPVNNLNFH